MVCVAQGLRGPHGREDEAQFVDGQVGCAAGAAFGFYVLRCLCFADRVDLERAFADGVAEHPGEHGAPSSHVRGASGVADLGEETLDGRGGDFQQLSATEHSVEQFGDVVVAGDGALRAALGDEVFAVRCPQLRDRRRGGQFSVWSAVMAMAAARTASRARWPVRSGMRWPRESSLSGEVRVTSRRLPEGSRTDTRAFQ